MLRTIGVKTFSCFLMTTLSRKYFVDAGRTRPEIRLMAISPKPRISRPRRGLISAQTSGSDFQAFFLFSDFEGVADFASDAIVWGRMERLSWMLMLSVRVHFNLCSNKDGRWLKLKYLLEGL